MGCIDKKISELSQLITPAVNDLVPIVDVSVADFETKYITYADFFTAPVISDYIDLQEIIPPAAPPADTLRLYVEDVQGFSFFSFIDSTGMVRKIVRDSVFVARNMTGVNIPAFRVVYATGSSMGVPTIDLARSDVIATMPAIGVTIEAIADTGYGRVIQVGLIEDVNTAAYPAGSVLYVSDVIAGRVVIAPPITPHLTQEIGTVLVSDAAAGAVQIVARSLTGDEYGTAQNIFYIGDGLAGNKTLTFNGVANASIIWDGVTLTFDGVDVVGLAGAPFVTMALDANLTSERVLTGTANQVIVTDGGAGGPVTLSTPQDIHILATPQFDGMTLTGQLFIDGGADEIQLRIQADAAQTANIHTWEDSAGNVLSGVDERGILFSNGNTLASNMFIGNNAGNVAATGGNNICIGQTAGDAITTGAGNFALGTNALSAETTGSSNVAIGTSAMQTSTNISGFNVAIGNLAMFTRDGTENVAIGNSSMEQGVSGNYNVGIGPQTLYVLNDGHNNVGIGYGAGRSTTTGDNNTFIGRQAGYLNTTGSGNIHIGYYAGLRHVQSDRLIVHNQLSANEAAEITDSILYGVMAAAPANQTLRLNARIGVRMTPTIAQVDVIQPDNAGAIPVASWEQTDIDQVLWKIIGTAEAASADRTLVAASDYGTPGALVGWIQIEVQDDGNRIPDADYWVPFHATPT